MQHSVVPIESWDSLKTKLFEYSKVKSSIVLINCGINIALTQLSIPKICHIYIIDSKRPANLENVSFAFHFSYQYKEKNKLC